MSIFSLLFPKKKEPIIPLIRVVKTCAVCGGGNTTPSKYCQKCNDEIPVFEEIKYPVTYLHESHKPYYSLGEMNAHHNNFFHKLNPKCIDKRIETLKELINHEFNILYPNGFSLEQFMVVGFNEKIKTHQRNLVKLLKKKDHQFKQ